MSKRTRKLKGDVGLFLKQYQRKSQSGVEPNDRRYDRKIEKKIKNMNPEELSEIIVGESEITRRIDYKWFNNHPIDGIMFGLNDPIEIVKGEHAGNVGRVISLIHIHPEPKYCVELEKGGDVFVLESQTKV